jgi:dihydrofolate reductase
MRTLTSDLFISLDGFAAGENVAAYFGYDGPDLSAWIQTEICKPQVLLMGRSTYVVLSEVLATATDPISTEMQALPKLVLSSTLSTPLAWSNTHLLRGEVLQQIRSLKQQPGDPIRSIGSLQLVRSLMKMDLLTVCVSWFSRCFLGKQGESLCMLVFSEPRFDLSKPEFLIQELFCLSTHLKHESRSEA